MTIYVNVTEPEEYRKLGEVEKSNDEIRIDYLVEGSEKKYAIERKTIPDLVESAQYVSAKGGEARLWEQCEVLSKLKEQGYVPFLVLEGNIKLNETNYNIILNTKPYIYIGLPRFLGILIGVASWGIGIIPLRDVEQFKMLLEQLDEKAGRKVEYERPSMPKGKKRTLKHEREDVLRAITGIGSAKAESLIKEYKTPTAVIEKLKYADGSVVKVLGKKYEHVRKVLIGK